MNNGDIRGNSSAPRPRTTLIRGADGRLRAATDEDDIGDIWAQQKRIQLQEAIAEDQRKEQRQKLRKQKGLAGLAKHDLKGYVGRARSELFGEDSVSKSHSGQTQTATQAAQRATDAPKAPAGEVTRTLEVNFNFPALTLPKFRFKRFKRHAVWLRQRLAKIPLKTYRLGTVLLLGAALVLATFAIWSGRHHQTGSSAGNTVPGTKLTRGTPNYGTVLPAGKSITQLGGWVRVSPPNKNPVYAYVDHINGISVDVSEQPLPPNLQTPEAVANLAKNFDATEKLQVNGTTAYLGTSAKGPQSVIMAKGNLLILLKSAAVVPSDKWVEYINSLQ